MDQDFHCHGTYYAARTGGFSKDDATLLAKAANFIDFFTETTHAAYWKLIRGTQKAQVVAALDNPRYTFQGGLFGSGLAPEDGLWCAYRFTPGNHDDPANTPIRQYANTPIRRAARQCTVRRSPIPCRRSKSATRTAGAPY
jgi:hypothetical protein